jgi:hypothetical protein
LRNGALHHRGLPLHPVGIPLFADRIEARIGDVDVTVAEFDIRPNLIGRPVGEICACNAPIASRKDRPEGKEPPGETQIADETKADRPAGQPLA